MLWSPRSEYRSSLFCESGGWYDPLQKAEEPRKASPKQIQHLASLAACSSYNLTIPANDRIELNYSDYEMVEASVKNKSDNQINVAVMPQNSEDQIRGFGLNRKSNADVLVEGENRLVLQNTNSEIFGWRADNYKWFEIDTPQDLQIAEKLFLTKNSEV